MFDKLDLTAMSQALAAHSAARLALVARNTANADTPGWKALDMQPFAARFAGEMRAIRPGHLSPGAVSGRTTAASGFESPNGNDVSLEQEMVKAAEARQGHEMALTIWRATSDVIRASLGGNR